MHSAHLNRKAISACAAAVLAGCNASLVQLGPATPVPLRTSREVKSQSLLYLSDMATNDVYVYLYPQGTLVSTLTSVGQPRSECADSAGNIWVADIQAFQVVEYAHGASKPIAALSVLGAPRGCSVDPKTGDLAVSGGLNGTVLSVYHHTARGRWRDPRRYSDAAIRGPHFCGYDAAGNLFIDGSSKVNGGNFRLAELSRGSGALVNLTVSQSISAPGQVQWDGNYVAVGDAGVSPSVVYQFSVNGRSATKVGSTILGSATSVRQFWIAAKTLVGPNFGAHVGFWNYPAGGSPTKRIALLHAYGAAVSPP